ncbi:MAG: WecB/TagA/CpsF family glycosyltransferase, partial [Proteobacteria bacterium]|nr:WecB/TagA/CpsF family glycosyltransferase [Pseudomonadota bacterium]
TFLKKKYPGLHIACAISPPFRELTPQEDEEYTKQINKSGARILFVSLGCPKQERWMADHKDRLSCVMLGVGAAFDFLSGKKKHAPRWMQKVGLEWIFRLACEPRRLWKRYFKHNPRFIWYFGKQLIKERTKS